MSWFTRLRERVIAADETPPDGVCPRCGATAPGGYVVAYARGPVSLGWVTGEPGWGKWRDVILESRWIDRPARVPGHWCSACELAWFDLPRPDATDGR